jgi:peptidoglycan hydrolase CwlO-like protein
MKMIKALILLATIAISLQSAIERSNAEARNTRIKKVSSKSKASSKTKSKLGPCSAGYFDVTITIDGNESQKLAASFDAREAKIPAGESLRGWRFTVPTINELAKKVLYQAETTFWFLPYRSSNIPFSSVTAPGSGKIITTTVQTTATESHSIVIQFAYDPNWEVIEENVLSKIVSYLNANRSARQDYIKDLKVRALSFAVEYKQQTQLANVAGASATDITSQIAKLNADIATLTGISNDAGVDLANNGLLILDQRTKIEALKAKQLDYDTILSQLAGVKNSQESTLAKYRTDVSNNASSQTKYKDAYDAALQKIDGLISTYRDECANKATNLDTARSKLISEKATGSFNTYIKTALSGSS